MNNIVIDGVALTSVVRHRGGDEEDQAVLADAHAAVVHYRIGGGLCSRVFRLLRVCRDCAGVVLCGLRGDRIVYCGVYRYVWMGYGAGIV
mgnify:CR=1 FL=1